MNETRITFASLLAPVTPAEFVRDTFRQYPLHILGSSAKTRHVCNWQDFGALLDMTALWTGSTLRLVLDRETIPPEDYCIRALGRDDQMVMRPDFVRVQEWLARGATIVADLVETLTPGIRATARALEMGLGAEVTCNAYCSQAGHQAFPSHFDSMEVFALQISGTKVWRIYERRFEHPVERPGHNYSSFDQAWHDQARGPLAMEVTLKPGDLLYIPKGTYHDALASDGESLHLSFGLTEATGLDYLRWVLGSLDDLAEFREALPAYDDRKAHDRHIGDLVQTLHRALQNPTLAAQFREEQRSRAHRLQSPVQMPPGPVTRQYRVRTAAASLTRSSGQVTVETDAGVIQRSGQQGTILRWIMERDSFLAAEMAERFDRLDIEDLAGLLSEAQERRLVVEIN